MYKWILGALLVTSGALRAQDKALPKEAAKFLLPGYEILDYVTGRLNNDTLEDALLVLKQKGEDTMEMQRPLLILIRQPNGQLKKLAQNDSAILCYQCGGIFGDPYAGIDIDEKSFIIHFYGGSSWRWSYDYTFTFNAATNNWYLVHQEESSYHNTEIDETQKDVVIEKEELGNVPFTSFNANPDTKETTWKVVAGKTYFYDNPKKGGNHRKGYLLKGDTVTSYRQTTNFVYVYYENKKAQSVSGFILKNDLVKIQ